MPRLSFTVCYRLLCTLWVCVMLHGIAMGQSAGYNINYRLFTHEDGLANRNVNAGVQDSRGFIWLGTKDGLNKYDGYKFLLFTKEKNGLQENNIVHLSVDADSNLWVLYGLEGVNTISCGKIDIIDINTHKITPFSKFFPDAPFLAKDVIGIAADRKNNAYIYCNTGYIYLYSGGKKFRQVNTHRLANLANQFVFINNASDSGVWLRYNYFLKKNGDVTVMPTDDSGYKVIAFKEDNEMLLLHVPKGEKGTFANSRVVNSSPAGTIDYDSYFSEKTKRQYYDICMYEYYMVLRDRMTGSTVIQNGGNSLLLLRDRKLISLIDSTNAEKIPSLSATCVFTDNSGKLWVCTNIGAMVFKINPNRFHHYVNSTEFKLTDRRPNYQARCIDADTNGNVVICTTTGVYNVKHTNNGFKTSRLSDNYYVTSLVHEGDNYYFGNPVWKKYNINTGKTTRIFTLKHGDMIWQTYTLGNSGWWLSNKTEFILYKNGKFRLITDCKTGDTLKNVWTHQFFKDRSGSMWAVGSKGLYKMMNDSCAAEHWGRSETDVKYKVPFNDVHCVYEDREGDFWVATNGKGLYKWNRKEHSFLHFTIADGLSSNLLYGILEDERGFLWISSDNGLMRFNKENFSVRTYTTEDGLTNNEFNRLSYFKSADGRMYFGGVDGVNAFYPKDFWEDSSSFSAPLQVISFNQFRASSDKLEDMTADLLKSGQIVLQPGDKFFILEFALLDFENNKHRYAYKIEGIDNEWNNIENNRIRISMPSDGNYLLKIKAQNNEGEWSANEISIPIRVIAPFYKRTIFFIIIITACLLLVFGYIRYRTWQYRRRNKLLEKQVESRTGELRTSLEQKDILLKEIHHRVKNNLQVISSLLQLQSMKTNDKIARDALWEGHNRVLSIALIHQKLYANDQPDVVDFEDFIIELINQLKGIFSTEVIFNFRNNLNEQLLLNIDVAVPLALILNELMTNSLKYAYNTSEEAEMTINISRTSEALILEYSDNGPGLPDSFSLSSTGSLGAHLILMLTKQLNGKVEFYNSNGACFKFVLPVKLLVANPS